MRSFFGSSSLNLHGSHELLLLGKGLESSMSVLGRGIDEFDIEFLGHPGLGGGENRLSEDERSLASTNDSTLDEDEIFIDNTVVRETTHRSDVLLNGIGLAHSVGGLSSAGTGGDSVDFLVHLSSRVVTQLSASSNSPLDCSGMPGSDTSDLAETSVRFTLQPFDSVSLDDTGHTVTASDSDGVDDLVVFEDISDLDLLLKVLLGESDLIGDGSSVNLDFHDVVLVLSESEFADLGGAKDTDNSAVLADAFEVTLDGLLGVLGFLEAVGIFGEGLLLGVGVVSVHASLGVFIELLGPDGG